MINIILGFCFGSLVTGLGALWLFDNINWDDKE